MYVLTAVASFSLPQTMAGMWLRSWGYNIYFTKPSSLELVSLVPRTRPLTRKRVWWLLSDFLVVPTQQYWFLNKRWLHACMT